MFYREAEEELLAEFPDFYKKPFNKNEDLDES
jgi:hypothetical protein